MLTALVQASAGSSTSGLGTAVVFGIIAAGILVMVLLSGSLRRLRQNQDAGTFGAPRPPRRRARRTGVAPGPAPARADPTDTSP